MRCSCHLSTRRVPPYSISRCATDNSIPYQAIMCLEKVRASSVRQNSVLTSGIGRRHPRRHRQDSEIGDESSDGPSAIRCVAMQSRTQYFHLAELQSFTADLYVFESASVFYYSHWHQSRRAHALHRYQPFSGCLIPSSHRPVLTHTDRDGVHSTRPAGLSRINLTASSDPACVLPFSFLLLLYAPPVTPSPCICLTSRTIRDLVSVASAWTRALRSSRRSTRARVTRSTARASCLSAWWTHSGLERRVARDSMTIRASREGSQSVMIYQSFRPRSYCAVQTSALSPGGPESLLRSGVSDHKGRPGAPIW